LDGKPKVLPVVWLLLTILVMTVLHWFGPQRHYLVIPWTWVGLFPAVLGTWMAAKSAQAFRRRETGLLPFDEATALVTDGFFRFTRNPMYLGMVLALLGLSLLFGCWPTLLPVAGFALIIHYVFILREERFMEEAFGDEYVAYTQRVRRWL
jgi:protein-S-isoprenylcysteine O-methyltransferase Ste14